MVPKVSLTRFEGVASEAEIPPNWGEPASAFEYVGRESP